MSTQSKIQPGLRTAKKIVQIITNSLKLTHILMLYPIQKMTCIYIIADSSFGLDHRQLRSTLGLSTNSLPFLNFTFVPSPIVVSHLITKCQKCRFRPAVVSLVPERLKTRRKSLPTLPMSVPPKNHLPLLKRRYLPTTEAQTSTSPQDGLFCTCSSDCEWLAHLSSF